MKEKVGRMLKWAFIGNILHLLVAGLQTRIASEDPVVVGVITFLALVVWIFAGFNMGSSVVKGKETDFLLYGILCVLPVLIFNVAAMVVQATVVGTSAIQSYSLFYFIGAPVLFWNAPFYSIMNLFSGSNIYIQMNMNMLLVAVLSFIGAYAGKGFRIRQLKTNRKKQTD